MPDAPIDFNAFYRVDGMEGVAFTLRGYAQRACLEHEWCDCEAEDDPQFVVAVMVGDDYRHYVDIGDLILIDEDDFCAGCGQIGCGH